MDGYIAYFTTQTLNCKIHIFPISISPQYLSFDYNLAAQQNQPMQSLPRNGSYFQRRKMYVEFPLHNMKSKLPIQWQSDLPETDERYRLIAREEQEKEYIKRMYDQKMERKLREKYQGTHLGHRAKVKEERNQEGNDVLAKQLEQFNTSKVINTTINKNNPENTQQIHSPYTPTPSKEGSVSSSKPSSGQQQQQRYRKQAQNYENDREPFVNQRQRRYSERQKSYDSQKERDRELYNNNNGKQRYSSNNRQGYNYAGQDRSYIQQRHSPPRQPYASPNQYSPMMYRGQSDLSSNPYRPPPPYYAPSPIYKPPYQDQNQFSYDASRQYLGKYHNANPNHIPGQSQNHAFRNALPDRLEQFLREKTKADRKSTVVVNLKNR